MTTNEWFRHFDGKLDDIHAAVIENGERLAAHEVRICKVELNCRRTHDRLAESKRHWTRYAVSTAVGVGLLLFGAVVSQLIGGCI